MSEPTCRTCRHFQPAEQEGWGLCPLKELWPVRPQEVRADRHSCEPLGSRWAAVAGPAPAKPATPLTARPRPAQPNAIPAQPATPAGARPRWVKWFLISGVVGLCLLPFVFFPDMVIGIPLVPELTVALFLASLVALGIGAYGYFFYRE